MANELTKGPNKVDSVSALNNLMETIYPPIFKIAQDKNIPIIDLANTYDIYDDSLYRSQIEPSEKGGMLTCELIKVRLFFSSFYFKRDFSYFFPHFILKHNFSYFLFN